METRKQKRRIIIENKIFAGDQQNQLLRYYNFDKQGILLYLTLNGNEPSEWSTNNEIQNNKDFHCISYKVFITNWLEKCIVLSKDKPKVSETIFQYLHIIKSLTNQPETMEHSIEVRNAILKNLDNLKKEIEELKKINFTLENERRITVDLTTDKIRLSQMAIYQTEAKLKELENELNDSKKAQVELQKKICEYEDNLKRSQDQLIKAEQKEQKAIENLNESLAIQKKLNDSTRKLTYLSRASFDLYASLDTFRL